MAFGRRFDFCGSPRRERRATAPRTPEGASAKTPKTPARPLACAIVLAGLGLASSAAEFDAEDLALPALAPAPFLSPDSADWNDWSQPHLFGDWFGIRARLKNWGVDVNIQGVDEAVANLSGGLQRTVQEAGQVGLQAKFDLQKIIGLQGGSFEVTLVQRWGRNLAADAGIPALQLLNEVYGRGNILRLEEFAYKQELFDGRFHLSVGRLAFGDDFFSFNCDFINLTFCGAPPGNIVGNYIYNWPISQWAAVGQWNFTSDVYLKSAVYDSNPAYLDTTPGIAILPTVPAEFQGVLVPVELGWKPKFGALMGDYKIGGWWNNSAAPNVAESLNGQPILVSGLPGLPGHGRYGFSTELQQQLTHDSTSSGPEERPLRFLQRHLRGSADVRSGLSNRAWALPTGRGVAAQGRMGPRGRHDRGQSEYRQCAG